MGALLTNIFDLLTDPSGNLVYHLGLIISLGLALQGAIYH